MTTKTEALKLALEALEWFVENDDTNIGQDGNEFWEDGLNNGIATIAEIKEVLSLSTIAVDPVTGIIIGRKWKNISELEEVLAQPKQETDWEGIAADQAMTIALMKSEQEPVYLIWNDWDTRWEIGRKQTYDDTSEENRWLLYTSPQKREWVEMPYEVTQQVRQRCGSMVEAVQYINNWLKEKNT